MIIRRISDENLQKFFWQKIFLESFMKINFFFRITSLGENNDITSFLILEYMCRIVLCFPDAKIRKFIQNVKNYCYFQVIPF